MTNDNQDAIVEEDDNAPQQDNNNDDIRDLKSIKKTFIFQK